MMTEERLATRRPVELRGIAGARRIGGYGAVFRQQSQDLGGFTEIVAPTFFDSSQADGWPGVICRYQHDDSYLLGSVRGNTLKLSIDRTGLLYTVDLPQTRDDILELVERGDVTNSSFAFSVIRDDWSLTERSLPLRTLESGKLIDVAPVSNPAYLNSTVSLRDSPALRSLAQHMDAPIEDVLALSSENELRRLFVRSDLSPAQAKARLTAKSRLTGATALAQTKAKAPKPISGCVAKATTLGKKHPKQVVV
jgi:HK97 family phage prohead protease